MSKFENRVEIILNGFCRTCWGTSNLNKSSNLFNESDIEYKIIKFCCSSVETTSDPDIPLCEFCVKKIKEFKTFYISCANTDRIFRHKLKVIESQLLDSTSSINDTITEVILVKQEDITDFENDDTHEKNERVIIDSDRFENIKFVTVIDVKSENLITTGSDSNKEKETETNFPDGEYNLKKFNSEDIRKEKKSKGTKKKLLHNQCDICEQIYDSSEELLKHKNEYNHFMANNTIRLDGKSSLYKVFKCLYCEKTHFRTKSSYQDHLRTHTGEKLHACTVCGKSFIFLSDLRRHSYTHTSKKPYQCGICSKGFNQKAYLRYHMGSHKGEKVECEICGLKLSPFSFPVHKSRAHASSESKKTKAQKNISQQHSYVCEFCGKKYATMLGLTQHLQNNHDIGQKSVYKCQYCNKEYNSYAGRSYHITKFHSNTPIVQNQFTCEICGKNFLLGQSFRQHMMRHNGDTRYQCSQCGFVCLNKKNLKCHLISHSGVKNFACQICNKRFVNKGNLKSHMLIHAEEKNYHCEFCDKSFYSNSALRKHKKVNHKI